ncbi:MAG TPA: hypothetical protein VG963_24685 [Polyangiaceae bacterium]|nr:hypothetical protein [Polyangiaceae bacterium]
MRTESLPTLLLGPCPCDGCASRRRCAEQLLACSAFALFARGALEGRWRAASTLDAGHLRYLSIYTDKRQRAA